MKPLGSRWEASWTQIQNWSKIGFLTIAFMGGCRPSPARRPHGTTALAVDKFTAVKVRVDGNEIKSSSFHATRDARIHVAVDFEMPRRLASPQPTDSPVRRFPGTIIVQFVRGDSDGTEHVVAERSLTSGNYHDGKGRYEDDVELKLPLGAYEMRFLSEPDEIPSPNPPTRFAIFSLVIEIGSE